MRRLISLRRKFRRYQNYYIMAAWLILFILNYNVQHTTKIQNGKYKNIAILRERTKSIRLNDRSCPNLFSSNEHEKWQPVGYSTNIHVYSAFSVDSDIRIIGAKLLKAKKQVVYCQLWYNNKPGPAMTVVRANISVITENRGLKYTSSFFNCKYPNKYHPYAVSLVPEKHFKAKNKLSVNSPAKVVRNFTVCIKPLHFKYSRAFQLVEFIELSRILGAEKFVFYNSSTSWNVDEVLWHYCKENIIDVFQWQLPMRSYQWPANASQVEIHAYGQLAAQNDCLYRYRNQSKYLVFLDVDEFIIPHKHKYWIDMMNDLPASFGEYNFQNTFFRKEWPDTNVNYIGKNIALKHKLYTFLKLSRENKTFKHGQRSKYIINPNLVEVVGIHSVQRFKSGVERYNVNTYKVKKRGQRYKVNPDIVKTRGKRYNISHGIVKRRKQRKRYIVKPDIVNTRSKRYNVKPHIGLLHHYRDWENPNDTIARINDTEVLKYGEIFLNRVYQVWETLKNIPFGPFPIN